MLQKHWPALHEHVQSCVVPPIDTLPPSLCQPMGLQQPVQQSQHRERSQKSQQHDPHQQVQSPATPSFTVPMPPLVIASPPSNSNPLGQQQQLEHVVQAAMTPPGSTSHAEGVQQGRQSQSLAPDAGFLSSVGLRQLWEHFQHDTQVVSSCHCCQLSMAWHSMHCIACPTRCPLTCRRLPCLFLHCSHPQVEQHP